MTPHEIDELKAEVEQGRALERVLVELVKIAPALERIATVLEAQQAWTRDHES